MREGGNPGNVNNKFFEFIQFIINLSEFNMKLFSNKADIFFRDIKKTSPKAILLHGPDSSTIKSLFAKIEQSFEAEISKISYSDFCSSGALNHLNSMSLFASQEIVKVEDVSGALTKDIKAALLGDNNNLAVFIAGELPTSSALRKFFEAETSLVAIGCYEPTPAELRKIIIDELRAIKKNIDNDAIEFLLNNCRGNSQILRNEISKLVSYSMSLEGDINLRVVQNLSTAHIDGSSADLLCNYFAARNKEKYFQELHLLLEKNISPIWILRALIRYYNNLAVTKTKMEDGQNIEQAIRFCVPPIFFKNIPSFKGFAMKKTLPQIITSLERLSQAEINCKSTGTYPENICEQIFYLCR